MFSRFTGGGKQDQSTLPVAHPVNPAESEPEYDSIAVVVPSGVASGGRINVQVPGDSRVFNIVLPQNCSPGETINVMIPKAATGGQVVEKHDESTVAATGMSSLSLESHTGSSGSDSDAVVPARPPPNDIHKAAGAAAAAAVVGTLVVGPCIGLVCAGAAVYASSRSDKVGEATLAVGGAAIQGFNKVKDTAEKYGVFEKAKQIGGATLEKAKQIDAELKLTDKASAAASSAYSKAKELDQKHEISSSIGKSISSGISLASKEATKAMIDHHTGGAPGKK